MEQTGKKRSACARGILKYRNCKPLPRPGQIKNTEQPHNARASDLSASGGCLRSGNEKSSGTINDQPSPALSNGLANKPKVIDSKSRKDSELTKVFVKYSYKANPGRPGGFDELSIKQGDYVYFHEVHNSNPLWSKVEKEDGGTGYVPADYIMKIETKPSQLPWLENRQLQREAEREKEEQNGRGGFGAPAGRKYVSAYNAEESTASSDYSCELCGKVFNGPKPYRLHMSSRAHKEEEEAQKYM